MRKAISIFILISISFITKAQQNFQLSQPMNAGSLVNPAFVGTEEFTRINLGYRNQWAGWDKTTGASPKTYYLTGGTSLKEGPPRYSKSLPMRAGNMGQVKPIYNRKKVSLIRHAIGGYAYADKFGYYNRTSFGASYGVHYDFDEKVNFSGGIGVGATNIGLDGANLTIENPNNDLPYNELVGQKTSKMSFDASFGLLAYSEEFIFGYSSYQLTKNKIFESSTLSGRLNFHHNIMFGYNFEANKEINVIPTILFQGTKGAPLTFNFMTKVVLKNKYWGGLGLRNEDAIMILLGGRINDNFNLSYSYDINTSKISKHSKGGHEIVLGLLVPGKNKNIDTKYVW